MYYIGIVAVLISFILIVFHIRRLANTKFEIVGNMQTVMGPKIVLFLSAWSIKSVVFI